MGWYLHFFVYGRLIAESQKGDKPPAIADPQVELALLFTVVAAA